MKRLVWLFLIAFAAAHAPAQPTGKIIHVLAIVDGFRQDDYDYYNDTVVPSLTTKAFNLVKGGSSATLDVKKAFLPSATLGASNLGLEYNGEHAKCYFDYDDAVLKRIYAEAGTFRPDLYLVILAGNGEGGCADGTVMFVRENALRRVVAHEMGHALAGLYDEYGADPGVPDSCIRWRNCASNPANTPWPPPQSAPLGAYPGCDGYSRYLFHAAPECLMITTADQTFCPVCNYHLTAALKRGVTAEGKELGGDCNQHRTAEVWTPPAPAPGAFGDLDVIAVLTDQSITVLSALPLVADRGPEVITGDVLAVVTKTTGTQPEEAIIGIKPLAIDSDTSLFTARGGVGTFENRVPRDARLIRFTIYGVSKSDVQANRVTLQLVLQRAESARSSFYVDERTMDLLETSPRIKIYELNTALKASWF